MSEILNGNIPIYTIKAGSTSVLLPVYMVDSYSASAWAGRIDIPYNAGSGMNLSAVYCRQGSASATAITIVDGTHVWTSGGWENLYDFNQTLDGIYILGLPDAMVADGANWVLLSIRYFTDGGVVYSKFKCLIHLVDYDPHDSVRMGLTALPNAIPGANGGLVTQNGTKLNQTVDLTAGQSIACADKTGFSLSAAGLLAFWDSLISATYAAGSFGAKLKNWVYGTDYKALISADTHTGGVTIAAVTGAVGSVTTSPTVAGFTTAGKAEIQSEVEDALDAAMPAVPTTGSLNQLVKTNLDAKVSEIDVSGISAPPTVVAIREEIDANSTQLDAIRDKCNLFGTGIAQGISPMLAADRILIVSGDDYSATDSRAVTWSEGGGGWPVFSGTITLEIDKVGSYSCTYSGTTGSQVIVCALTAAQTLAMPAGIFGFNLLYVTTTGTRKISLVVGGKVQIVKQVKYVAA